MLLVIKLITSIIPLLQLIFNIVVKFMDYYKEYKQKKKDREFEKELEAIRKDPVSAGNDMFYTNPNELQTESKAT